MLPRAVAVVGPTATGKTAAGIALCRALEGEVVSIDSMQIYRGMDIGTAKPDRTERAGVPHHLLDVADPGEAFSAARYRELADAATRDILARGKLPIYVGGTGLYLNALTYDMDFAGAQGDSAFRAPLEALARTPEGREALHGRLRAVDPGSAERLHPNDSRRVIRALEIYERTGRPMTEHAGDFAKRRRLVAPVVMGLRLPRERLNERIDQRVSRMMEAGLYAEVQRLHAAGVPRDSQAMQAIGYKELYDALEGQRTLEEAVALIAQCSRQYAKRQQTWFQRDDRVHWFDILEYPDAAALHAAMVDYYHAQTKGAK